MSVKIKDRDDKLSPDDILSCREPVVMLQYPDRASCPAYELTAPTVYALARLLLLSCHKSPKALVTILGRDLTPKGILSTLGQLAAHRAAGPSFSPAAEAALQAAE